MKNISFLLNFILIFLVVYLGCKNNFFGKGDKPVSEDNCKDHIQYNPAEKYGMISFKTAKFLAENYAAGDGKKFIYNGTSNTGELDARNIWFDLKILKNFIALIESSACKANCDTSKKLGIRIYYAKYPDSSKFSSFPDLTEVPKEYGNHHTVFMIPTFYDNALKMNVDFDPLQAAANCTFKPFSDNYTKLQYGVSIKKDSIANISAAKQQLGKPQDPKAFFIFGPAVHNTGDNQNHGSINPPPDQTGVYPTPTLE